LVVQLLDWDLSAVTPVDFIEQMLSRLSDIISDSGQRAAIRRHATTFVAMCTTGYCLFLVLFLGLSDKTDSTQTLVFAPIHRVLCSIISASTMQAVFVMFSIKFLE